MLILYLGNFNLEHKFVVLVDQRFNLENEQGEAVVYVIELYICEKNVVFDFFRASRKTIPVCTYWYGGVF